MYNTKELPPFHTVSSALEYDAASGMIMWRYRADMPTCWNARFAGKEAGNINRDGHRRIKLNGSEYLAHRLIWLLHFGTAPDGDIDHRNRLKSDNRIENLRIATCLQNSVNKDGYGKSMKGAYRQKSGAFQSQITVDGRTIYLGSFESESAANSAYKRAALELHGEFAAA